MVELVIFFIGYFFGIGACASMGSVRGRTAEGLLVGILTGPLGVIYMGFLPYGTERCFHCHGWCYRKATVCQNCGREYPSANSPFPGMDPMKVSR